MQFEIHQEVDSCQPSPQYSNPRIVVREHHGAPLLNWSGLVLPGTIERVGKHFREQRMRADSGARGGEAPPFARSARILSLPILTGRGPVRGPTTCARAMDGVGVSRTRPDPCTQHGHCRRAVLPWPSQSKAMGIADMYLLSVRTVIPLNWVGQLCNFGVRQTGAQRAEAVTRTPSLAGTPPCCSRCSRCPVRSSPAKVKRGPAARHRPATHATTPYSANHNDPASKRTSSPARSCPTGQAHQPLSPVARRATQGALGHRGTRAHRASLTQTGDGH